MVPSKCASTSDSSIQPKQDSIIIECAEKIITYKANEVELHSTTEILQDHLCAKLNEITPQIDSIAVSKKLVQKFTSADIFSFLQNQTLLVANVNMLESTTPVPNFDTSFETQVKPKGPAHDEAVDQNPFTNCPSVSDTMAKADDEHVSRNVATNSDTEAEVNATIPVNGDVAAAKQPTSRDQQSLHNCSEKEIGKTRTTPSKQLREPVSQEKLQIGEDLFHKVAEIETELCAQITGMLLEMDKDSLMKLLQNDEGLESAVTKAKTRYLTKHHPGVLPGKDDIGEEIYEVVNAMFPEYAAKITGMILELDIATLQQLIENPSMIEKRAKIAYGTVAKCSS